MRHNPFPLVFALMALGGCAGKAPPPLPPPPPAVSQAEPPPALPPAPPPPAPAVAVEKAETIQAPPETAFFSQSGLASFYGHAHDGNSTANGRRFDHRDFTAAHRSLPFGTLVRVTNLGNGRTVTVEITDRGPRIKSRLIDISLAAARALHMQHKGVTRVRVEAFRRDQAGAQNTASLGAKER